MVEHFLVRFDSIYAACVYLDGFWDAMIACGRIPQDSTISYIRVMEEDWVRIIALDEKSRRYYGDVPHCKVLLEHCCQEELEQITEVQPMLPVDTN